MGRNPLEGVERDWQMRSSVSVSLSGSQISRIDAAVDELRIKRRPRRWTRSDIITAALEMWFAWDGLRRSRGSKWDRRCGWVIQRCGGFPFEPTEYGWLLDHFPRKRPDDPVNEPPWRTVKQRNELLRSMAKSTSPKLRALAQKRQQELKKLRRAARKRKSR